MRNIEMGNYFLSGKGTRGSIFSFKSESFCTCKLFIKFSFPRSLYIHGNWESEASRIHPMTYDPRSRSVSTSQAADQHRAGTGQKQLKHLYRFHPTLSKVSTTRTGRVTSLTCRANGDRMYFSLSIDFYVKIRMSLFAGSIGIKSWRGWMGSPIPGV